MVDCVSLRNRFLTRSETSHQLVKLADAIEIMHRPAANAQIGRAIRRLAFDEFLYNQIAAIRRRARWRDSVQAVKVVPDHDLVARFVGSLGFETHQRPARKHRHDPCRLGLWLSDGAPAPR